MQTKDVIWSELYYFFIQQTVSPAEKTEMSKALSLPSKCPARLKSHTDTRLWKSCWGRGWMQERRTHVEAEII